MLSELRVCQLGVIEDVTIVFSPGMTALTGETGAGKTLLIDALQLLMGGPADPALVRPGGLEAVVEGRFARRSPTTSTAPGEVEGEVILTRVVPRSGRSRAYIDGRMVAAAQLAEIGAGLADLHGQHSHQSLLSPAAQRSALDAYAAVTTDEVTEARRRVRDLRTALDALGGDQRARLRELDVLRFQLGEIDAAGLGDPDEDDLLRAEEETLADAAGLRTAAAQAWQGLSGDEGVADRLGMVSAALAGRTPLAELHDRAAALQDELADLASDCRSFSEGVEDDPERLAAIGTRRHLLSDLRRKYGDTIGEIMAYGQEVRAHIEDLESYEERAAAIDGQLAHAEASLADATSRLWTARRQAAPGLSAAVQIRLADLAMAKARFEVTVGEQDGSDEVTWLLGANPGEPVLPLTKVASGGELARTMLAARLAVGPAGADSSAGPRTLVFDEVDAGVGGEAAVSVGQALAALVPGHQVLVVTHLPQVAAFADHQLVVTKHAAGDRTVATVQTVAGSDRIVELARMLSGSPDSPTARSHAEELLGRAHPS